MSSSERRWPRSSAAVFFALSTLLHAAVFFAFVLNASAKSPIELKLPDEIEFGMVEADPGKQGSPPPVAPPAPTKPTPPPPKSVKPAPKAPSDAIVVPDAGPPKDAGPASDAAAGDAGAPMVAAADAPASGQPGAVSGEGQGEGPLGSGLGFGSGGFGGGKGGPVGAVIGFHADLDEIRRTSLLLEVGALLAIIPEWQKLLQGSGLNPLKDFSRIFVATPSLRRSDLVVSARVRGGQASVQRAAQRLAEERGKSAALGPQGALSVAPWYSHGPTEREVALVAPDQFVVARPRDVPRVLGVSAALARRHAKQPEMEKATGAAALLAMYEGEAAALSVEGAREMVVGDNSYVPLGLRISLRHLDELHATLRVFGYYENAERAGAALERIDELRHQLAHHPRVEFLGLTSAMDEAKLERTNDTLRLETMLTLHQTRYLMAFLTEALKPRD